jgi:uncharacterized protein YggE
MTSSAPTPPAAATVAVTGQGRREVRPDLVEFHFVLEGVFPSVREAEDQLHHRRAALLSALEKHRTGETRLTCADPVIASHHEYEHHAHVFKGYKASDHLILRAPLQPGLVNAVLHSIAAQIKRLTFTVRHRSKKTSAALRSARAEAVRDARRKASHFAEAAGHQLGRLFRLSDTAPTPGHVGEQIQHLSCSFAASEPVEIDPESDAVTAEVHAVWELLPA